MDIDYAVAEANQFRAIKDHLTVITTTSMQIS